MKRTYQYAPDDPARKDRTVMERTGPRREDRRAVLAVPKCVPPHLLMEVLDAIKAAYQDGREDRSAELLPIDDKPDALRAIVHSHAFSATAGWIQGYTQMEGSPVQYRISVNALDEPNGTMIVSIADDPYGRPLKRFRLRLLAEEIEP